jgi:hypothetical protein
VECRVPTVARLIPEPPTRGLFVASGAASRVGVHHPAQSAQRQLGHHRHSTIAMSLIKCIRSLLLLSILVVGALAAGKVSQSKQRFRDAVSHVQTNIKMDKLSVGSSQGAERESANTGESGDTARRNAKQAEKEKQSK